MTMKLSPRRVI